jgi:hypothetical protein
MWANMKLTRDKRKEVSKELYMVARSRRWPIPDLGRGI